MTTVCNKSSPVKLGLIGCGRIGEAHINGLRLLRAAGEYVLELTAICSRTRARAEQLADTVADFQGLRPKVYTDYQKLFADGDVASVSICTEHAIHHTIGVDAFNAGKHCLIEKPLALTVAAARLLVETAKQKNLILATAENYRRKPRYRTIKWMLEQGLLGDIITAILLYTGYGTLVVDETPWRHLKAHSGPGRILDQGAHHADLFEYFLGGIKRVYARATMETPVRYILDAKGKVIESVACDAEDTCHSILHFANGANGIWYSTASGHGRHFSERNWILIGTKGNFRDDELSLDNGRCWSLLELEQDMMHTLPDERKNAWFPAGIRDDFAIELHDFARAIRSGGAPEIDGEQGLRSMAIAYAFCESSLLGAPVLVSDVINGKISGYQDELNRALGI